MQAETLQRAIAYHKAGQFDAAVRLYRDVLRISPERFDVRVNLGAALSSNGALDEAIEELRQALVAWPTNAEANNNLGSALQRAGRQDEAMEYLQRAIILRPNYADAINNLGLALMERQHLDRATAQFRRCLEIDCTHADAAFNLGNILLFQERPHDAIAHYRVALASRPDFARARYNLGTALCRLNQIEEGFKVWTECSEAIHGIGWPRTEPDATRTVHHAQEQQVYLAKRHGGVPLSRLRGGAKVSRHALNNLDGVAIAREWESANPKFALIDDALSPAALAGLQAFCLESGIWNAGHLDGYVIAGPEDGMACPLMAQIVMELRVALPDILGRLQLHYIAGFKYAAGKGSNVHADSAAVNVNLWITPDEANLEPNRGGLLIWDLVAPGGDLQVLNGDTARVRTLLSESGAKPSVIPYRCNRMTIFDSDLFHETDHFLFKDLYKDRRINITMLFGQR